MNVQSTSIAARAGWLLVGVISGALLVTTITTATTQSAVDPGAMNMGGATGMDGMPAAQMDPSMDMAEAKSVSLTPDQIRQFGITFATVQEGPVQRRIRATGTIRADERRIVEVTPKFSGYVERLYADFVGRPVKAGTPLLDVYAPELVAAQEEVLLARELQAGLGAMLIPGSSSPPMDLEDVARQRLSLWDVTEEQIEALIASGNVQKALSLSSPITGVVLEKSVTNGSAFKAGQVLFRIADLASVWVVAELRETEAGGVIPGSGAQVTLTAYPGEIFSGTVDFVYPVVDARTRSVRARVVLKNPDGRLRPGMLATVQVTTPEVVALSIPSDAVIWTGERTLLFVEGETGDLQPIEIQLGATVGEQSIVLSGVSAGQRVVTSAQYLVDAEANIGAIMRSMMGMMGAGDSMDMEGMDMGGMEMGGMDMTPDAGATESEGSMRNMDTPKRPTASDSMRPQGS